jgi:hypothetical protein
MDFEWDPDEPPATFDDPNLPSFVNGPDFFGELVGYDMLEADVVAPWSLEEPGYANDAPNIQNDGRIDGQQHLPDYYAYSLHTDTWEDGLQEIEGFDWSIDKGNKDHTHECESKAQDKEDVQAVNGADIAILVDQDEGVTSVDGGAVDLHAKIDSPTTPPKTLVQKPNKPPPSDETTSIPEVPETIATRTYPTLSLSDLGPGREEAAAYMEIRPRTTKDMGLDSPVIDDQYLEARDVMYINDPSTVVHTERSDTGLETEGNVAAEESPDIAPNVPIFQEGAVEGDIVAEMEPRSSLEDNNAVKTLTLTSAPAPPSHGSVLMHESDLETPPRVATAPQSPPRESAIDAQPLAAPHTLQEAQHPTSSCSEVEATHSSPEASDQTQTQQEGPIAQVKIYDNSTAQIDSATDALRLPSEGLPKVLNPPLHQEAKFADVVQEVQSGITTTDQLNSTILIDGDSVGPMLPGALSRMQDEVEGPWQAQSRNAADEAYSGGLVELLTQEYHESYVPPVKMSLETIVGEASVHASPLLAISSSAQQLNNDVILPPLPFPPENNYVYDENSGSLPAEVSADGEHTPAAQLAYRPSKPPSPSDLEPASTPAEDHKTVPDVENNRTTVTTPGDDLVVQNGSSGHAQDTTDDPGSTTSAPESKAQSSHSEKRSRLSRKAKSASETESDAPLKKKPRMSTPAKSRASRAGKSREAPEEQEYGYAPSLAETRRGAVNEKPSSSAQHEKTSKLGHFAYRNYTGPSLKVPIADESSDEIFSTQTAHETDNADMEEHYSDVEVPITPSRYVPAIENVPSTPKSRPKVSDRELQGLTPTTYRDRSSKSKPISRQLFSSQKPGSLDTLKSGMVALEDSLAVSRRDTESLILVVDSDVTDSNPKVSKRPVAKPRATSAKVAKAKHSPAASGPTKKNPAARATKKRKVTREEEEEYDLLFPPSMINAKPPSPEVDLPLPPRFTTSARRTTRSKKKFDKNEETRPSVEDNDEPDDKNADLEGDDEDGDDFEDAQEIIEASDNTEEADEYSFDTSNSVKKPQLKNKYGYTLPRTRQATKAAGDRAAPTPAASKTAPKAKAPVKNKARISHGNTAAELGKEEEREEESIVVPKTLAKGKGKKSTASAATATPKPTKQPSVRKTRRASAMEQEIT